MGRLKVLDAATSGRFADHCAAALWSSIGPKVWKAAVLDAA